MNPQKFASTATRASSILLCLFLFFHPVMGQQPDSIYQLSLRELLSMKIELGSRVEQRTKFEALAPVDVYTSEQLMQTGCQDLGAALQRLVSSVQYFTPTLMDGADHVYPLLMRGLNADQVLVLINGKRYHSTAMLFENSRINKGAAAVDFRTIPIHAVERIEILKDGASAQYGSDAIAGIINIILKTNQENSVAVNYGINSELDGQQYGLSAIYGSKFSQGNYQFFLNYNDKDKTDRAGLDDREQYFANDPLYLAPPVKNQEYGQAKFTDFNIGTTASVSLDPQTRFYAVAMLGHRVGESPGYFRRPLDNRNVREIYPHGFLPFIAPVIKNTNATVGLETKVHGWDCDISATYGGNTMEFHVKNSLNASLGARSPQSFYCGSLFYSQQLVNANLKRKYSLTEEIPLFLAVGAEFGLDNYKVEKGDQNSYVNGGVPILDGPNAGGQTASGAQVLPGISPSNEIRRNRHNLATYLDAETKLFDFISLGGAARAEEYSDFGETVNGKISLRADFLKYFAIRGSVGTGFRAPSLSQAYYSSTTTNFIDGLPYENGLFNTEHPIARQLGAKPLKPERSENFNAGFIVKVGNNLNILIDAYYIKVYDRIMLTGNFTANNAPDFTNLFASYGVGGARYFTNAINTSTQGLDFTLEFLQTFSERSNLKIINSSNFNNNKIVGDIKIPQQVHQYFDVFFDQGEVIRITESIPDFRTSTEVTLKLNKTSLSVKGHYFGSFIVTHGSVFIEQEISSGMVFDMNISHSIGKNIQVTLGGVNILNNYPDEQMKFDTDAFTGKIFPYSPFSPYGFAGAHFYGQVSFKF